MTLFWKYVILLGAKHIVCKKGIVQHEKKVRKLSIRYKILIPASVLILIVCIIMGLNAYSRIKTRMIELGVEEAQMAAAIAQSVVDGDVIATLREGSEDTQEYKDTLETMRQVQETCGIAYLYTLYVDDSETLFYGVDTDTSEDQILPGELAEMPYDEFADVFAGHAYVQAYIDETEDGDLISAYLPVFDTNGKVVAVLGCDYDAAYVSDKIAAVRTSILQLAIICIILAWFVLNLIVSSIMRSLRKVDSKIYDLVNNEGDLTQKLEITSGDELELIADNVNALLE